MADPVCDSHELLQQFWPSQQTRIDKMELNDFREINKHQELPIARIKKIMKIEDNVKTQMVSAETPILLAKASELIVEELTIRAWIHTQENKRKTIQKSDVATAVGKCEMFDFLIDIVPREEASRPQSDNNEEESEDSNKQLPQYIICDGSDEVQIDGRILKATQIGPTIPISGPLNSVGGHQIQIVSMPSAASGYQLSQPISTSSKITNDPQTRANSK